MTTATKTTKSTAKAKATATPTKQAPDNRVRKAPAKAAGTVKKQTPKMKAATESGPTLQPEGLQTKAARAEKAALDVWVKAGSKGKRPATPNYDAVVERSSARDAVRNKGGRVSERAINGKSKGKGGTRSKHDTSGLRYYVQTRTGEMKPQTDKRNRLSAIANGNTKNIVKSANGKWTLDADVARIGGVELLVEHLKSLGVTDPFGVFKPVEMANGVVIECRKDSPEAKTAAHAATRKAVKARQAA